MKRAKSSSRDEKEEESSLKERRLSDHSSFSSDCCVCLDEFELPVALPCRHSLCWLCLNALHQTNQFSASVRCPLCRFVLPSNFLSSLKLSTSAYERVCCDEIVWKYAGRSSGFWLFDGKSNKIIEAQFQEYRKVQRDEILEKTKLFEENKRRAEEEKQEEKEKNEATGEKLTADELETTLELIPIEDTCEIEEAADCEKDEENGVEAEGDKTEKTVEIQTVQDTQNSPPSPDDQAASDPVDAALSVDVPLRSPSSLLTDVSTVSNPHRLLTLSIGASQYSIDFYLMKQYPVGFPTRSRTIVRGRNEELLEEFQPGHGKGKFGTKGQAGMRFLRESSMRKKNEENTENN